MNDKYNNIDELLKESLKDYGKKPSKGVWQKITLRLWLLEKGIFLLIPFLVAVFTLGYFLFNNSESSTKNIKVDNPNTTELLITNTQKTAIKSETQNKVTKENIHNSNSKQITQPEISTIEQPLRSNQEQQPGQQPGQQAIRKNKIVPSKEIAIGTKKENISEKLNKRFAASSYQNQMNSKNFYPGLTELEKTQPINIHTSLITTNTSEFLHQIKLRSSFAISSPDNKPNKTTLGDWSYGIHIVPEIIFTNNEDNDKKQSVSLDLAGIYSFKNVYLQFGAGISLSNDKSKFNIDYSQYDSIGYYFEVTGFSINQQTGQPIFKTELENVYDTIFYNQTENADNLFTYLRIPVYFGVHVFNKKRMTISAKAGGIYSLLLKSRMANYSFTNDNATWINVVNESYSRAKTNFQISIAVGAAFRVRNNLSLSIEPAYNYFFNQLYVNSLSTKSPWSVSLKTGIIFKF